MSPGAALAALLTLGFALEAVLYRFNGLDFVGDLLDVGRPASLAGSVALCLGGLLTGAARSGRWSATSPSATAPPP